MIVVTPHHSAISSRDLGATKEFYAILGFELAAEWTAKDDSLVITHLMGPGGLVLEVFSYSDNVESPPIEQAIGNDLNVVGVKHIGFDVPDLDEARSEFLSYGRFDVTDVVHGRTGIDYFFVKDPNGIWVEFVRESRRLDVKSPILQREQ